MKRTVNKKGVAFSGLMMTILINGMVKLSFNVQPVEATGTIYIKADGSIEPSTAPIQNLQNSTYIFTSNINDSIVVERHSIVIDGAGYTLRGMGSEAGITFTGRSNVTVKNTRITKFSYGIYLYGSSNITLSNNTIINNEWDGIYLVYSDNNFLYGNIVSSNKRYGIMLSECGNNRIFHNNFINNYMNQTCLYQSFNNMWNASYPSGGNYWSDYNGVDLNSGPYQNDTGSDGIGDYPYSLDAYNQDYYPLIAPISLFDVDVWNDKPCKVEIISNSTVSNFQLNKTQNMIIFNVSGVTGLGFCKVIIPNIIIQNMWQNNYTVFLDKQQVEFRNWTDEVYTYIYFIYPHQKHEALIVPESLSTILLLLLFPIITASLIVKRRYQRNRRTNS